VAEDLPRLKAILTGRYTIERELGRGGMATVYLARDLKHDRPVALKVLRPDLAAVLGGERFLREIRLTAQLQHPHILTLIDSGEADGFLYYVMPYVEGESLRQRLEREGQLPLDEALRITRAVASALDFAHGRGVIHRDIKPENIMLHQGEPMVADFGIALAVSTAGRERLTETGLSLGTPAYMSPEQASSEPRLDGRSDQYSLACVLYEMLAGEPPYTGPTAQAIIAKRFSEPAPHLRTVRDVPEGVEQAVTKALAKVPAARFATAAQFGSALADERPAVRAAASPRRRRLVVLLGVPVLAVAAVGVLQWRARASTGFSALPSVAVLPFTNLSGDTATDYFSDGMTEELINALVQVEGLRVPARTSTFAFKGRTADISEVGRRLNVANVVEGSVRREGTTVRITAQLITVANGYHVWSRTYDRDLRGVLAVQEEIARAIAGALEVKLRRVDVAALARRHPENLEAYDLYLRGRYFWYRRTADGMRKAIEYYQRAIALDSGYALAYSGLADTYVLAGQFGYVPRREAYPKAKAAALKAVALDSGLAEGFVSLARVRQNYDWDWPGAQQAFRRAIELNPRYGLAHSWYGLFLGTVLSVKGRADEAIREGRLAIELDPLNGAFNNNHGLTLLGARRYTDAIEYYSKSVDLLPKWTDPHWGLGRAYLGIAKYDQALAEFETARRLAATNISSAVAIVHARMGRRGEALDLLRELQRHAGAPDSWSVVASLYAALGDRERTLAALDTAVERRAFDFGPTLGDPQWDLVRSDPRFARILTKAGLRN